jgi:hypothetical protein
MAATHKRLNSQLTSMFQTLQRVAVSAPRFVPSAYSSKAKCVEWSDSRHETFNEDTGAVRYEISINRARNHSLA